MKLLNKKNVMFIVKGLFVLLVVIFLTAYFRKNLDNIRNLDIQVNWKLFVLAMVFYNTYLIILASLWHYITKINDVSISYGKALVSYMYSIPGKYIPGKVFMLAARYPAYKREDKPLGKITICFFLENICNLLGAAFLFLISLFYFPDDLLDDYVFLTILLVIAFFICIHPKIINFFLKILEKILKKENLQISLTYSNMLKSVLFSIGDWFIAGIGFYILVCSVYPIPLSNMLCVGGIFGLSVIIGVLSLFAPSGIGVREGILVVGLLLVMPQEYAVIISIICRVWTTVAELLLVGAFFLFDKMKLLIKN